jgi:hypothetical protein
LRVAGVAENDLRRLARGARLRDRAEVVGHQLRARHKSGDRIGVPWLPADTRSLIRPPNFHVSNVAKGRQECPLQVGAGWLIQPFLDQVSKSEQHLKYVVTETAPDEVGLRLSVLGSPRSCATGECCDLAGEATDLICDRNWSQLDPSKFCDEWVRLDACKCKPASPGSGASNSRPRETVDNGPLGQLKAIEK